MSELDMDIEHDGMSRMLHTGVQPIHEMCALGKYLSDVLAARFFVCMVAVGMLKETSEANMVVWMVLLCSLIVAASLHTKNIVVPNSSARLMLAIMHVYLTCLFGNIIAGIYLLYAMLPTYLMVSLCFMVGQSCVLLILGLASTLLYCCCANAETKNNDFTYGYEDPPIIRALRALYSLHRVEPFYHNTN